MSVPELTPRLRRRNLIAVITSMAVTTLIYGLSMPLLALALNHQGVDPALIGLSTASQFLAGFAVAPFAPRFMRAPGPAVSMLCAIGVSLLVFLLLPVFPNVWAWFPLRFVLGAAGSYLWMAGDAWVNQVAEEHSRGRVVALYSMATAAGFASGPLLLTRTGSTGALPFLVSAVVVGVSALPLLLAVGIAPRLEGRASRRMPGYLLLAPVAMFICATYAAAEGILLAFLPIYGLQLGVAEKSALYLITVMGLGGIACQLAIGWLADRMDRMLLTALCAGAIVAGTAGLPLGFAHPPWNALYMFLYGGALGALYTMGVVLMGERFRGADLAAASALYGVMWGVGSIVGPPLGGAALELWPPHGMPAVVALLFLAFLPLPLASWLRRRAAPPGPRIATPPAGE